MGLTFTEKCASTDPNVLASVGPYSNFKTACNKGDHIFVEEWLSNDCAKCPKGKKGKDTGIAVQRDETLMLGPSWGEKVTPEYLSDGGWVKGKENAPKDGNFPIGMKQAVEKIRNNRQA